MSKSDSAGSNLKPLLVAVPVGVLSCLVTLWVAQPASSPPLPASAVDTHQLFRRLDDLTSRIDAGFRTASRVEESPVADERQPISKDTDVDEMNAILNRLEYLLLMVRSGAGSQVPVQRDEPINWNELDALVLLSERDRRAAERSTMLLTPDEVVERFGFPARAVGGRDGVLILEYTRPGGRRNGWVSFNFMNGLLISQAIHDPDR